MMEQLHWFALRTVPQREGDAQALLTGRRDRQEAPKRLTDREPKGPLAIKRQRPRPIRRGNGLICIIPLEQVYRHANKTSRRKSLRTLPLMRGWVFCGFPSLEINWLWVMEECLITGVAGDHRGPIEMPARGKNGVLDFFQACDRGLARVPTYKALMRSRFEYDVGDLVEVAEGPFMGQTMRVEKIEGNAARVFMDLFGRRVEVWAPLDTMMRVE